MSQKLYLRILKVGVFLSLLSVFIVYKSVLFPFISSKQITFNILLEIMFIFWVGLLIQYPNYRPKKSYISIGLLAYLAVATISCFTSKDFNLSFWGDVERMLGVFHVYHFLLLYFVIITVFNTWKDWKSLIQASLLVSILVALHGFINGQAYSTLGNTAYMAGYMIFNIYFALLLTLKSDIKWEKVLYLLSLPILIRQLFIADSSGAYVGFFFSVALALFLYGVFSKNRKIKLATISSCVVFVLVSGLLMINKNSEVFVGTPLNFLSELTFQKNTFQTRLISWRAALKDMKNQPIIGTGFGNFAYSFDKYFEPKFYEYTSSETYFDRAHNNIIDIAATTGILGLIAYLSFLIAVAYYLLKGYLDKRINIHEFVITASLIVAYFVQNLAVFDSLVTYIALMLTLGFVYWMSNRDQVVVENEDKKFNNQQLGVMMVVVVFSLFVLNNYNLKPLKMLTTTIDAQILSMQGDFEAACDKYIELFKKETILDRDSRNSFVNLVTSNYSELQKINKEKRDEILNQAVLAAEKNTQYNPKDSLMQLTYAQMLNYAAQFHKKDNEKFTELTTKALEAVDNSIAASPKRTRIYYQKANILRNMGKKEEAIEIMKYATELSPSFYEPHCRLAELYLIYQENDKWPAIFETCVDLKGLGSVKNVQALKIYANHYIDKDDLGMTIKIYTRLSQLAPKDIKLLVNLAALHIQNDDNEKAEEVIKQAISIQPSIENDAREFIKKAKEDAKQEKENN